MVEEHSCRISMRGVSLTFDGKTYIGETLAQEHEKQMCKKIEFYLERMPHAFCYNRNGDSCTAYYVSDDLDWAVLKLEVARIEDQYGYSSIVRNQGIERYYRLRTSLKNKEVQLLPYDDFYIRSGKIDGVIQAIDTIRKHYKQGEEYINEKPFTNLYL